MARNAPLIVPIALIAVTCGLLVGACGSSEPHSTTEATDLGVKFAVCMRGHGATHFPDPGSRGGLNGGPPSKTETESPRFTSAFNICRKILPNGGPPPGPGFTEAQLVQMVAKVHCLRQHGFPNLPDPDPNGDNIGRGTSPAGWNPNAPAAINAMKACAKVGIGIPGWLVS